MQREAARSGRQAGGAVGSGKAGRGDPETPSGRLCGPGGRRHARRRRSGRRGVGGPGGGGGAGARRRGRAGPGLAAVPGGGGRRGPEPTGAGGRVGDAAGGLRAPEKPGRSESEGGLLRLGAGAGRAHVPGCETPGLQGARAGPQGAEREPRPRADGRQVRRECLRRLCGPGGKRPAGAAAGAAVPGHDPRHGVGGPRRRGDDAGVGSVFEGEGGGECGRGGFHEPGRGAHR